ncbi:YraN family protein [Pseudovibrio sp. Tun.PSC04-5.I4]|uniref:YraN family protein n=1 Tax=Pseudovibrio sp. Tun.PSC04-5.I4 TaxID=1798213 RepID=UPI001AD8D9E0|nr:YraN family protein [Pseudovibrio sp. Tun.PSC04-5.I4]
MKRSDLLKKQAAYRKGLTAELKAEMLLRQAGWQILERRYKTRQGEIDLIAEQDQTIVFVEVKARRCVEEGLLAITPRSQRRIANAAREWVSLHDDVVGKTLRFDAVILPKCGEAQHFPNLFEAEIL